MATLNIGLRKLGKRPCQCRGITCVHKGEAVARQTGAVVPVNGPGEWVPQYTTLDARRDPSYARKKHRRGNPAMY